MLWKKDFPFVNFKNVFDMQNSAESILGILEVCKICVYSQVEIFFLFMNDFSTYLVLIAVRII